MIDKKTLKQFKEASGMSLQEVAAKAGYTTQTVWSAMRGEVSDDTAAKIMKVLVKAVEARRAEADRLLATTTQPAA